MLRTTILTIYVVGTFFTVQGQYWEPLGGGVKGWGSVLALQADTIHDLLYVGGIFDSIGDIHASNIAVWDGTVYHKLPFEPEGVNDFAMKGDTLLALSGTDVSKYVDTNYIETLPAVNGNSSTSKSVYVYHDTIYVGGDFLSGIAFWSGSSWEIVGDGVYGPFASVETIGEYNDQLIIGGHFDGADGNPAKNIAAWNGSTWTNLGEGITFPGDFPVVYAVKEFEDELYVSGDFEMAGDFFVGGFAKWNGVEWDSVLNLGLQVLCGSAYSFSVEESLLFAVGEISFGYGCPGRRAAVFDGTNWINLDLTYEMAYSSAIYGGSLIAGGDFKTTVAGDTVNKIARLIGMPTEMEIINGTLGKIVPNPTHYTIDMKMSSPGPTLVTIYNILGEVVKQEQIIGPEATIDVSNLPAGLYVARSSEGVIGKFVKE